MQTWAPHICPASRETPILDSQLIQTAFPPVQPHKLMYPWNSSTLLPLDCHLPCQGHCHHLPGTWLDAPLIFLFPSKSVFLQHPECTFKNLCQVFVYSMHKRSLSCYVFHCTEFPLNKIQTSYQDRQSTMGSGACLCCIISFHLLLTHCTTATLVPSIESSGFNVYLIPQDLWMCQLSAKRLSFVLITTLIHILALFFAWSGPFHLSGFPQPSYPHHLFISQLGCHLCPSENTSRVLIICCLPVYKLSFINRLKAPWEKKLYLVPLSTWDLVQCLINNSSLLTNSS